MTATELHAIVWKRFIRKPYGHLLDYAEADGSTSIPTARECQCCEPNPLGWWTPIENGAFFGGLYMAALIHKHANARAEGLAADIRYLAKGLMLLQDVGARDGFIARGVADDGHSHYPCSSEDQVTPWLMGMYAYMHSGLCEDTGDVSARLLRALRGLRACGWSIPCDAPYTGYVNRWLNARDWRGVCKLLYCARMLYQLSGKPEDLEEYSRLLCSAPDGCAFTRLQIASHGFSHDMVRDTSLIQLWIDVCAHLALRELAKADTAHADAYRMGCAHNGITALRFVEDMFAYDNLGGGFDVNWRPIKRYYQPFDGDVKRAVSNACADMHRVWTQTIVPHRHMEHVVLGNALFGAWIALTSNDETVTREAARLFTEGVARVDFSTLTVSYAFVAESCWAYIGA